MRPHENNRGFLWRIFLHRGIDFLFYDALQTKIDGQMHLVTVPRRALLATIRNDFLAGAVMLDETISILSVQVFFHRGFHPLHAVVIEVGKANHVAKHRSIRIEAGCVLVEIDSAEIARAQFFTKRICSRSGYFALNHNVAAAAI